MQARVENYSQIALKTKDIILSEFIEELNHPDRQSYIELLHSITATTLSVTGFKVPRWGSSERLVELKNHFFTLKDAIKKIQIRDYLSITPKVEDIKVVYKWIETFNVPHFYSQVFFDKVYGVSFEQILSIISNPENEGSIFSVESDSKNQNKTTIKVKSKSGMLIGSKVEEPSHKSIRREMDRGRLLFYVTFNGGTAILDVDNLIHLLGIKREEF
jgi:type II restriction enzyme